MKSDDITRREAVGRVGLGAAALVAAPGLVDAASHWEHSEESTMISLNENVVAMNCEDWKKLLNETFHVTGCTFAKSKKINRTKLQLIGVDDQKHESDQDRPQGIRQSGFSLLFQAPLNTNVDSRTHCLVHEGLGTTHLHLQWVHRGNNHLELIENKKRHCYYEAVIN